MLVLEVTVNGKRICIAGTEDLAVLNAGVTACGKLGSQTVPSREDETVDIFYSVGGLTRRRKSETDVHVRWNQSSRLLLEMLCKSRFWNRQLLIVRNQESERIEKVEKRKPDRIRLRG